MYGVHEAPWPHASIAASWHAVQMISNAVIGSSGAGCRWCLRRHTFFSKEHEMFALCPEEFGTFYADGGGGGGGMCVGNSQPSAPPAHRDEKEKGGEESYA